MLAIPTVRVLRSVSGADEEVVEEAAVLLGCDILHNRGTRTEDDEGCVSEDKEFK